MWIKRDDTRIHYKTPAKTYYEGVRLPSAGNCYLRAIFVFKITFTGWG